MIFLSRFSSDSSQSTGLQFVRVYNVWHTLVKDALAKIGLTHPQYIFLAATGYLAQFHECVTQKMISDTSSIDPMTVSQLARLLENKNFIKRLPHPTDTRAKSIVLESAACDLLKTATPIVEDIDNQFFGQLGEKESDFRQICHTLLSRSLAPIPPDRIR